MKSLLDTNILVRTRNAADPRHASLADFPRDQTRQRVDLLIVPQNLFEFWVVVTRPVVVNGLGLGLRPDEAHRRIEVLLQAYTLLHDPPDLVAHWLEICRKHGVIGRAAHDARLVATMTAHGVRRLITLNASDFARYPELECVAPL